jgi:hypothetical protein
MQADIATVHRLYPSFKLEWITFEELRNCRSVIADIHVD